MTTPTQPSESFLGQRPADNNIFRCPACNGGGVHIEFVILANSGGPAVAAHSEWAQRDWELSTVEVTSATEGATVALGMRCESCLDPTMWTFSQHKGETAVTAGPVPRRFQQFLTPHWSLTPRRLP